MDKETSEVFGFNFQEKIKLYVIIYLIYTFVFHIYTSVFNIQYSVLTFSITGGFDRLCNQKIWC
jgi:hypothetical protein